MKPAKIHGHCWEAPGTYTACGLFSRNMKVTIDFEKVSCFRCRQIIRLLDAAGKPPAAPKGTIRAPKRRKTRRFARAETAGTGARPGAFEQGRNA